MTIARFLEQRSEILLIEMNLGVLGDKAWQGWHIFHKQFVMLLARYIPFFTRLITVVPRRAAAWSAAISPVAPVMAVTLVVVLVHGAFFFRGLVGLGPFGVHLRQHLGRVRIRLGFGNGRPARNALAGGFHALFVVLALQMSFEMNGGSGDEVTHFATHFHVLRLNFFDAFQHARVLLALHVRLVNHARVELEIAHFATEMAFVRGVDFTELPLLARFPLFLFQGFVGGDRAQGHRGQKGVETGLFQLFDVRFSPQVRVQNAEMDEGKM